MDNGTSGLPGPVSRGGDHEISGRFAGGVHPLSTDGTARGLPEYLKIAFDSELLLIARAEADLRRGDRERRAPAYRQATACPKDRHACQNCHDHHQTNRQPEKDDARSIV
jgi:hypothetical protein